jgi:hypothetical protein
MPIDENVCVGMPRIQMRGIPAARGFSCLDLATKDLFSGLSRQSAEAADTSVFTHKASVLAG